MFSRISNLLVAVVCSAVFTLTGGCSGPTVAEAMVPPLQRLAKTQPGTVSVMVVGGLDTNEFWVQSLGKKEFAKAVEQSIEKSGVVQSVRHDGAGDYHLEANLQAVDFAPGNSDTNLRMLVSWKLIASHDNRVVWDADIVSAHTTTVGEAFGGYERVKLASEGAARENIRQAMESLEAAIPLNGSGG